MYSHEVSECLRQVEFVLPRVAGAFDRILSVRVYDRQANIHATGLKDEALLKSATKKRLTEYDEYSIDYCGVVVFWLEAKEDMSNEAV